MAVAAFAAVSSSGSPRRDSHDAFRSTGRRLALPGATVHDDDDDDDDDDEVEDEESTTMLLLLLFPCTAGVVDLLL